MEIEVVKEENKEKAPVTGICAVNLKISDGIRFGFGFGLGMIIWSLIFLFVTFIVGGILVKSMRASITDSIFGVPQTDQKGSFFGGSQPTNIKGSVRY